MFFNQNMKNATKNTLIILNKYKTQINIIE